MTLEPQAGRPRYGPYRLWWLELSDDASRVIAAGRLVGGEAGLVGVEQRFPNVAVAPDGESRLVFLERRESEPTWGLRSVRLEFDARTGRPRAATDPAGPDAGPAVRLRAAPLLLSADAATVHGLSPSGRLGAWRISGRQMVR
jgi:hypothetical protein